MVLEYSAVVVKQGCLAARHNVKIICGTRVLVIVDKGRHEGCEDLQVRQPVLRERACVVCNKVYCLAKYYCLRIQPLRCGVSKFDSALVQSL